jgi:hypothetical protein
VLGLAAGRIAGKVGTKPSLIAGLALLAVGAALPAHAAIVFYVVGSAIVGATAIAAALAAVPRSHAGLGVGLFGAGAGVAGLVAVFAGTSHDVVTAIAGGLVAIASAASL